MNIKVSSFASFLHEKDAFKKENDNFIEEISKYLGETIKYSSLDDYDCDIKLILIASGGSENLFLSNIDILKEPFYLLTTGKNNSLAASLEILTYLNNNNLSGEILHGDINYIASRIKDICNKKDICDYPKLGVIGKPSDWLISSIPNRNKLEDLFKAKLVDISLDEVVDVYNKDNEFNNSLNGYDLLELNKSEKFVRAIDIIVNKYNLEGLTIRCFDLLDKINTTGCLSLAKLNERGIIGTCEGDIMALISMYLVKKLFGKSSFQANPSRIDVLNKEIDLAHCTCPIDMLSEYKYDSHFESGIGVAIKGKFGLDDVTVFRLSSDLKHYFIGEGKIVSNLDDPRQCRSQIRIKMNDDLSSLLNSPCGNHHIVFYGHKKDELVKYLDDLLGR